MGACNVPVLLQVLFHIRQWSQVLRYLGAENKVVRILVFNIKLKYNVNVCRKGVVCADLLWGKLRFFHFQLLDCLLFVELILWRMFIIGETVFNVMPRMIGYPIIISGFAANSLLSNMHGEEIDYGQKSLIRKKVSYVTNLMLILCQTWCCMWCILYSAL